MIGSVEHHARRQGSLTMPEVLMGGGWPSRLGRGRENLPTQPERIGQTGDRFAAPFIIVAVGGPVLAGCPALRQVEHDDSKDR